MITKEHTNIFYKTALLIVMLFSFVVVNAQVTDTLKEVKIKAQKLKKLSNDARINDYSPGQAVIRIDSTTLEQYQFQDLANLLSQQVPVFVKSYGLNNIATLNFRGASAAQSQVYWNGVPIQNAALGISDVSLLPVSLMNKVNVVYGSSSALWGSGNVGGAVMLENDLPAFDDSGSFRHSVSAVAASFGSYRLGLKTDVSRRRMSVSVNVFSQSAQNDFKYKDADDLPQTMSNARLQSGVGLLQGAYQLNNRNKLTARLWYQQYYREVPRALFESASVKNQRDESLRAMLQWDRNTTKSNVYIKAAFIRDNLLYQDSTVNIDSRNTTNAIYTEAGVIHKFNSHHKLMLFVPLQWSWIDIPDTTLRYEQNKYAISAAYLFTAFKSKLKISLNSRAEVVNNNGYVLPGINVSYTVNKHLSIRANVQRTYRVPTLNELHYNPGGSPNLKPERGWNQDVGYTLTTGRYKVDAQRRLVVAHSLSAYNRVINDWIIWFGGAIWTPHNIATVHSRGLQTENTMTYVFTDNVSLKLGVNGAYTLATTLSSYQPNDGSIGKQIPYTPLYNSQVNIGGTWKKIYLNYNHIYTGLRYITTDESYGLSAYTVGNIQMMYNLHLNKNELQLTAQCNNIWDANYQVVNARPMPGINWLLGVRFTFSR